ncbi:hypothetical protein LTS10_002650 [Elasticomyces elasticus]|nr:hypothetical protein LTS10_002650 [Elasticomyces elasticus]
MTSSLWRVRHAPTSKEDLSSRALAKERRNTVTCGGVVTTLLRDLWRTAATGCITCGILVHGLRLILPISESARLQHWGCTALCGGLDANLDRYELQYFDYDDDTLLRVCVVDSVDLRIRAELHFYVPRGKARVHANE